MIFTFNTLPFIPDMNEHLLKNIIRTTIINLKRLYKLTARRKNNQNSSSKARWFPSRNLLITSSIKQNQFIELTSLIVFRHFENTRTFHSPARFNYPQNDKRYYRS